MQSKSIIINGLWLFLFLFSSFALASNHIIIYGTTEKFGEIIQLKRYLEKNRLKVSLYTKVDQLDRHMENLNRMNNSNASFLIGLNMEVGEKEEFFIAVPDTKGLSQTPQGRFYFLEEVPGIYEKENEELAMAIASPFNARIKTLPLFYAVGLNMPCIFISMTVKKENVNFAFERLYSGIQSYLTRGEGNERQRKTK